MNSNATRLPSPYNVRLPSYNLFPAQCSSASLALSKRLPLPDPLILVLELPQSAHDGLCLPVEPHHLQLHVPLLPIVISQLGPVSDQSGEVRVEGSCSLVAGDSGIGDGIGDTPMPDCILSTAYSGHGLGLSSREE